MTEPTGSLRAALDENDHAGILLRAAEQAEVAACIHRTALHDGLTDDTSVAEWAEKQARTFRKVAAALAQPAPPTEATEAQFSREWCLKMAALEGNQEIGAGSPDHPLRAPTKSTPPHDGLRVKAVSERLVKHMREIARQDGWALAVHGSMMRDLDIVAVPWNDKATGVPAFVEAMRAAVARELTGAAFIAPGDEGHNYTLKPGGRRCYVIHSASDQLVEDETGAHPYVDLSVVDFRLAAMGQAFSDGAYAVAMAHNLGERAADDIIESAWPDYADTYAALSPSEVQPAVRSNPQPRR